MSARPAINVYNPTDIKKTEKSIPLPAVFTAPIRLDIV